MTVRSGPGVPTPRRKTRAQTGSLGAGELALARFFHTAIRKQTPNALQEPTPAPPRNCTTCWNTLSADYELLLVLQADPRGQ